MRTRLLLECCHPPWPFKPVEFNFKLPLLALKDGIIVRLHHVTHKKVFIGKYCWWCSCNWIYLWCFKSLSKATKPCEGLKIITINSKCSAWIMVLTFLNSPHTLICSIFPKTWIIIKKKWICFIKLKCHVDQLGVLPHFRVGLSGCVITSLILLFLIFIKSASEMHSWSPFMISYCFIERALCSSGSACFYDEAVNPTLLKYNLRLLKKKVYPELHRGHGLDLENVTGWNTICWQLHRKL